MGLAFTKKTKSSLDRRHMCGAIGSPLKLRQEGRVTVNLSVAILWQKPLRQSCLFLHPRQQEAHALQSGQDCRHGPRQKSRCHRQSGGSSLGDVFRRRNDLSSSLWLARCVGAGAVSCRLLGVMRGSRGRLRAVECAARPCQPYKPHPPTLLPLPPPIAMPSVRVSGLLVDGALCAFCCAGQ